MCLSILASGPGNTMLVQHVVDPAVVGQSVSAQDLGTLGPSLVELDNLQLLLLRELHAFMSWHYFSSSCHERIARTAHPASALAASYRGCPCCFRSSRESPTPRLDSPRPAFVYCEWDQQPD